MNLKDHTALLERLKRLKDKLGFVPDKPGVYIHKNEKGEILYVGKAKNLPSRLRSYFTSFENHSPKTKALVQKIVDYDVIVTENEYESLLLENNMIKHSHPPYNILLRDDKTYPYLRIDKNEDWPRVNLVRRKKNDGALYFGPYSLAGQVNQLMSVINRFFPLVKCTPFVFKTVTRPCYYYDIKKCLGPCKLKVDKKEYNAHLENVIDILNGKFKDIGKKIKASMLEASEQTQFEKAALLRDQWKALENLQQGDTVSIDLEMDLDVIGAHWNNELVTFHVSSLRNGKLIGGNSIVVKRPLDDDLEIKSAKEHLFSTFLCQYYSSHEIPKHILFSQSDSIFQSSTSHDIQKYLSTQRPDLTVTFYTSASHLLNDINRDLKLGNNSKEYLKRISHIETLSQKNAEQKFNEQIKIDESSNQMMLALKDLLRLDDLPRRIECYDISTFQGSQTVASQVVFQDGVSYKKEYKKYIIKDTVQHMDDFASLREVIRRRFHKRDILPDLIVIDGGTPQIREVGWTLKSLGLDGLNFIGLAKARTESNFKQEKISSSWERIVIPKRDKNNSLDPAASPNTIMLKEASPAYRILTQLRDEAHRFAISFHREKRDKSSLKSILSDIKGLGAKRRKQLLECYPDLNDMMSQDAKSIAEKTKIPMHVILDLKEKLANQKKKQI